MTIDHRPTTGRRPILFAGFAQRQPAAALERAIELATRLDRPLAILLISTDDAPGSGTSDVGWFEEHLPVGVPHHFHHASGPFVHETIHHATALDAQIVFLPAQLGQSSPSISAIAASAGVPVLIARATTDGDAIVAATALRDSRFPVVHHAAELLERSETTLVGVHDLEGAVTAPELERRRTLLAAALEPVSLSYEVVIDHEPDPADAVIAAARARDADLIVVGVPRRAWLDNLHQPCVATRILAVARRSVLLVPIDPPADLRAGPSGDHATRAPAIRRSDQHIATVFRHGQQVSGRLSSRA